jgi:hypothetical protein
MHDSSSLLLHHYSISKKKTNLFNFIKPTYRRGFALPCLFNKSGEMKQAAWKRRPLHGDQVTSVLLPGLQLYPDQFLHQYTLNPSVFCCALITKFQHYIDIETG